MTSKCKICPKSVADSDRITCSGYCGAQFHVFCAKVDFALLEQLGIYAQNVFWMCDSCAELFQNDQFRKVLSRCEGKSPCVDDAIKPLKEDIAKLSNAISSLAAKVESKPVTPISPWPKISSFGGSGGSKRRRTDDNTAKVQNSRGTKVASELVKSITMQEDLFWIYLSAFDPSTTEDDICALARDSLSLDASENCKAIKLIAKGIDPTGLNFISFKVGVNINLKEIALSPESWPNNIYFREFVDRGSNARRIIKINRPMDEKDNRQPAVVTPSSAENNDKDTR